MSAVTKSTFDGQLDFLLPTELKSMLFNNVLTKIRLTKHATEHSQLTLTKYVHIPKLEFDFLWCNVVLV